MTTNQILMSIGLILTLAVGSQVLASRLRIPVLIVLLPVGFVAGALTTDVNPERRTTPCRLARTVSGSATQSSAT